MAHTGPGGSCATRVPGKPKERRYVAVDSVLGSLYRYYANHTVCDDFKEACDVIEREFSQ
jgi:hypothetical protein